MCNRTMTAWFLFVVYSLLIDSCQGQRAAAIIRGDTAAPGQYPFMVYLKRGNSFICGGSLISLTTVLTAKHCVGSSSPSSVRGLSVVLGEHDSRQRDGYEQYRDVDHVVLHGQLDLAVLVLSSRAIPNTRVQLLRLHSGLPGAGTEVHVAGWGWLKPHTSSSVSPVLQRLQLPIAKPSKCSQLTIQSWEKCLGKESTSYTNVCHGDSGGPVMLHLFADQYAQVGVITRGFANCPDLQNYAIFISLDDNIRSWIQMQAWRVPATTTTTTTKAPKKSSSCFSGAARVTSPTGDRPMSDVRVGDTVLTLSPSGEPQWTEVILLAHLDPSQEGEFFHIDSSHSSTALQVSPNHLLFRRGSQRIESVFASRLAPGDELLVYSNGTSRYSAIQRIRRLESRGVYAPITVAGTILVDGHYASCYAQIESHAICHASYAPIRSLSSFWKFQSQLSGIHWYPTIQQALFEPSLHHLGLKHM